MGPTPQPRLRVAIIGAGRMGGALVRACARAGFELVAVGRRGDDPASVLVHAPDVVFIAVPDAAIEPVARALAQVERESEPLVVVTSGAASMRRLWASVGALRIARMHPMQSVTLESPDDVFDGVAAAITATDADRDLAHDIALRLGMVPFGLEDDVAATWHVAGVLASGAVTALLAAAQSCAVAAGLDERRAADAIGILARTTVQRVIDEGAANAMTGPVVRGDAPTVASHVEVLRAAADPDVLAAYASLTRLATRTALDAGRIDSSAVREIHAALGGEVPAWA